MTSSIELFSVFDPEYFLSFLLPLLFICILTQFNWAHSFRAAVRDLVKKREMGGILGVYLVLFYTLLLFNVSGLIPFWFSMTRHLAVNLSLALPMWFGILLIRLSYRFPAYISHLVPKGRPLGLAPALVLIETVRLTARPVTLAVRLTANLRTGHIIFGLLGSSLSLGVVLAGCFYLLFEIGVCVVQTYIFTILPTLYAEEHP